MPHDATGAAVRIVLDTNVVDSALLWRGTPYNLLQAAQQQHRVQLLISSALLTELAEVLVRPWSTKRLGLIGCLPREVLADYIAVVELVKSTEVAAVVPHDPDDDEVIAAAVAAKADLIVSGDNDLLSIGAYGAVRIVTPTAAPRLLTAS